jgi:hypothetical protein
MSASRLFARAASARWTGAAHAISKISVLFLLTLGAAGCTATPPRQIAAADPGVQVPATRYSPTLGRYTSLRPVEPLSWREQNERLMPQPKQ